ncbi:MAG: hypothetical protein ACFHWZ_17190 [Phycisphaerales bacterium]
MLSASLAILTTLVFAAVSRAGASVRSSGAPIVVLGVSASCAAALSIGERGAPSGAAELIVAPMMLALLVALAKGAVTGGRLGVGVLAGLVAILGGAGLVGRIDALNGQLLLLLALAVWWVVNSEEDRARRSGDAPRTGSDALVGLLGVVSGACIGWSVLDGASALFALGLVTAHLIVWALRSAMSRQWRPARLLRPGSPSAARTLRGSSEGRWLSRNGTAASVRRQSRSNSRGVRTCPVSARCSRM